MKCIILAGGFATRLWPLSEKKAKPLLHLKDKPLISHITEGLPHDIEIIVSVNKAYEGGIRRWAENYPDRNIVIFVEDSISDEQKKGALGATALAITELQIDEDLMLIAGDNYFGFKMEDFIGKFQGSPLLAAYDIQDLNAAKKFGVVVTREGKVHEFQEKPESPKSTLVSTGCYIFPQKNLADIVYYAKEQNDNLGGVFEYLLKKGETIDVFRFTDSWVDIGSFDAYLKANSELMAGQVIQGENVTLEGENKLENGVYLGSNARIKDSVIDNCIILPNCIIDDCVLRHCIIDENCRLTGIDLSHQMLRAGSKIEK